MNIGVISDTHGLMRPEALEALAGSELILHAGDIGPSAILEALRTIAPVVAVRGNTDSSEWARRIPETEVVEAAGVRIYMLHDLQALDLDPPAAGFRIVVSGHTHQPVHRERDGIHFLNPGSAGPRRFQLPVTVARVGLDEARIAVEIIELRV